MSVFLVFVPALLVVVLGYVIGHAVWTVFGGWLDGTFGTSISGGAEIAGWTTGALLLAGVVRVLLLARRRRRQ